MNLPKPLRNTSLFY